MLFFLKASVLKISGISFFGIFEAMEMWTGKY